MPLALPVAMWAQESPEQRQMVGASDPRAFFPEYYFPALQPVLLASIQDSPAAIVQGARLEETDALLDRARTDYNWHVQAYARYVGGYEIREDIDNQTRQYTYGNVVGRRPLYHWGKIDAREAQAVAQKTAMTAEVNMELQNHLLSVREIYLRALAAQDRKALADESLRIANRAVDGVRQLFENGQVSEAQYLELQVQFQEAEERVTASEREYTYRLNQLERALGRDDVATLLEGVEFPEVEPWTREQLQAWEQQILAGNLLGDWEQQRYDALQEQQEKEIFVAKRRYLPDINLEVGINTDRLDDINNEDSVLRTYGYGGLSLDWMIWDGWRAKADQRIARSRLLRLDLEERMRREENVRQAKALVEELNFLRLQIDSRERRAQLVHRQLELDAELGGRSEMTAQDRLRHQLSYESLRQDARDLRINYLLSLARLGLLAFNDPILSDS
ncbi:MAG: TolC family protein [Verrucomicrobiota bacterium JB022]|nr:TolC family protein [Verrucomicrobiota bacterium JB022]